MLAEGACNPRDMRWGFKNNDANDDGTPTHVAAAASCGGGDAHGDWCGGRDVSHVRQHVATICTRWTRHLCHGAF